MVLHASFAKPNTVKILKTIGAALLIVALALLRVVWLDSDAYARLSWSSALLTDEGFYIHNARNLVLFGHARTDDFNNALIMPLLHFLQVAVFRMFGVGALQARSISIVTSLLTLLVFFCALRRAFSPRVAWLSLLLLGFDPVFTLYNRLALMDTPACLPLVCAFYAWGRAEEEKKRRKEEEKKRREGQREIVQTSVQRTPVPPQPHQQTSAPSFSHFPVFSSSLLLFFSSSLSWLFVCGGCLGLAYTVRGLAAVVLPVPFLLLLVPVVENHRLSRLRLSVLRTRRAERQALASAGRLAERHSDGGFQPPEPTNTIKLSQLANVLALLTGLACVFSIYFVTWYLPHHRELARVNAFYLHHQLLPRSSHVLFADLQAAFVDRHRGVVPFLMKHSPILFLFGCAEILRNLHKFMRKFLHKQYTQEERQNCTTSHANYMTGWLLLLLLFVSTVDYSPSRYYMLFYPALAGLAALSLETILTCAAQGDRRSRQGSIAFLVAVWAGVNVYWYGDWIAHLTYRQRDADGWLAAHLPANSVLFGAVAPGLCLNNRLRCVPVIEYLCNDKAPVEKFDASPRYVLILDGDYDGKVSMSAAQRAYKERWKESWWLRHYPALMQPQSRLHAFPTMLRPFFTIGVYPAPPAKFKTKVKMRVKTRDKILDATSFTHNNTSPSPSNKIKIREERIYSLRQD